MNLAQPVPELPVPGVVAAQAYYRDRLGFEIAWLYPGGEISAVRHGDSTIVFRRSDGPIRPGTFWIFADDVDAALGLASVHRRRSARQQIPHSLRLEIAD